MKEKTDRDKADRRDDLFNGVTQVARKNEEEAIEKGLDQPRAGEEISPEIGMRIKRARESRGLSIFDVYLRTNIEVDLLSQIEVGKVTPPLGAVIKLAKALDLKMGYFVSGEERKAYTIVRRDDRKVTARYDSKKEKYYGYAYETLAPHKTDKQMEPFLVSP